MCKLTVIILFGFLSACSEEDRQEANKTLTVYKTESCGCCNEWVQHLLSEGFQVDVVNQDSLAHIKDLYGIPRNARSCHTAVSDDGKVFEGHVPAKWIRSYLDAPDDLESKGLVVPAMPVGSPGMEFEDKFNPYVIYQLSSKGALKEFVKVENYESQF